MVSYRGQTALGECGQGVISEQFCEAGVGEEGSGGGRVLCYSPYTEGKQDEELWRMTDDQISRQRFMSPRAFAVAHCLKG